MKKVFYEILSSPFQSYENQVNYNIKALFFNSKTLEMTLITPYFLRMSLPLPSKNAIIWYSNIFDRELCSKVLKEYFLLLLFLGLAGNHEQEMFQIKRKLCKGTKNVHKGFFGTLWY